MPPNQAPSLCRLRQTPPRYPQVRQREQRQHLCSAPRRTAIAHPGAAELPLRHPELCSTLVRMLVLNRSRRSAAVRSRVFLIARTFDGSSPTQNAASTSCNSSRLSDRCSRLPRRPCSPRREAACGPRSCRRPPTPCTTRGVLGRTPPPCQRPMAKNIEA